MMQNDYLKKYSVYFFTGIIVLAGFISYINIYNNQFLWDDEFNIQKNAFIRNFSYLPKIFSTCGGAGAGRFDNFYRPMKLVVYNIIYALAGLKPWAFHILNVLLHIGNALLIFMIMKNIFLVKLVAFFTSLLWVVHPVHTEAVTYTSATQDPLSVFFGLASFLLYISFKQRKKMLLFGLSCILFMLALLSKESIIILPGLFLLYEFVSAKNKSDGRQYKYTIPFFIMALIYFLLRLTVLNFGGTVNFYQGSNIYTNNLLFRIFTFLAALLKYYSLLFLPINLHMERQFQVSVSLFDPRVVFSLLILILLSFVVHKNLKQKKPWFVFGILWFFISFIPMSGIIPINALINEHWLYLPSIGFFLIMAALVYKIRDRYRYRNNKCLMAVGLVSLVLLISVLAGLTLDRNADWKDPITFYNNILKYNRGRTTARVHNNLAMAYADKEDFASAQHHYLKAIEIDDTYAQTHYNLARLYLKTGEIKKAVGHLERSLEINPNFFYAYRLLGNIYEATGDREKAEEYYKKARSIEYY